MDVIGIIAEFDPLHRGHAYLLGTVRAQFPGCTIVAAMSGSFTQRGDAACLSRFDRAELALAAGADLVALLPVSFACASAERFARGGVAILKALGCTRLCFGSESGDCAALARIAEGLERREYPHLLQEALSTGCSYAAAREAALGRLIGPEAALVRSPNDLLGVEYLRALAGSRIHPCPIRRVGAPHNSEDSSGPVVSASAIRTLLKEGQREEALIRLPEPSAALLSARMEEGSAPASLERCGAALLSLLRQSGPEDFARLPDVSEGLEHRLARAARTATSPEDFCRQVKTKRYAHARIRRILLWRWLGLTREDCPPTPAFLQVLGMSPRGQALLHGCKKSLPCPLIVRPAQGRRLSGAAGAQFRLECRADDLWGLCTPRTLPGGWSLEEQLRRQN